MGVLRTPTPRGGCSGVWRWLLCQIPVLGCVSLLISAQFVMLMFPSWRGSWEVSWVNVTGLFRCRGRYRPGLSMAGIWLHDVNPVFDLLNMVLLFKEDNKSTCWAELWKPAQMTVLIWTESNLTLTWGYEIRSATLAGDKTLSEHLHESFFHPLWL